MLSRGRLLGAVGILVLGVSHSAWADDAAPPPPMQITASSMTVRDQGATTIFRGNVVLTKGDMRLEADEIEVRMEDKPGATTGGAGGWSAGERDISSVHARGNVHLWQGERRAESEEATYDQKADKVTLTGKPIAWEGNYRVTGSKMEFFVKENRSVVERSRVVIQPSKAPTSKAKPTERPVLEPRVRGQPMESGGPGRGRR